MNAPEMNFRPKGLYIGGEWVASAGNKTFETINPSNAQSLGEVPYSTEKDVDRAVQAGKKVFPEWSR
ncbi:MAG: aldehyde dehydrogenase family protein, partial [Acidiferrobacterales bacterium]